MRTRVALIMFYQMNITKKLPISLNIGEIMKGKPAIAY